ncbi:hypothetical protein D068_cds07720 [Bacillus atrophaeus UCMB-5137]|nr:hypothetical protein D068_cds07720 [Bacillus atrophaeus UCMB-5137]
MAPFIILIYFLFFSKNIMITPSHTFQPSPPFRAEFPVAVFWKSVYDQE